MQIQQSKLLSTILFATIGLQAAISLVQLMIVPSEAENALILGYSLSRLLIAAVFLIIILFCIGFIFSIRSQEPSFVSTVKKYTHHPVFLILLVVGTLGIILSSSILIVITNKLNTDGQIVRLSTLSIENFILLLLPSFSSKKLYLLKLMPFFKWSLASGIDLSFYLLWKNAIANQPALVDHHPKRHQQLILIIVFFVFFLLLTVVIFFPSNQPLVLNIASRYDWLLALGLITSLGLLLSLVYYSKSSIRYFLWGFLLIGCIFNLIDQTYTTSQLELTRKPSNTLESFFITPNENYHFREYQVYQKFSRDYIGKELIISKELLTKLKLSSSRLIIFGRLSEVSFIEENTPLDNDTQQQLLNLEYSEILILDDSRSRHNDMQWIFIETGLKTASAIQIKETTGNMIFVYPVDLNLIPAGGVK